MNQDRVVKLLRDALDKSKLLWGHVQHRIGCEGSPLAGIRDGRCEDDCPYAVYSDLFNLIEDACIEAGRGIQ